MSILVNLSAWAPDFSVDRQMKRGQHRVTRVECQKEGGVNVRKEVGYFGHIKDNPPT